MFGNVPVPVPCLALDQYRPTVQIELWAYLGFVPSKSPTINWRPLIMFIFTGNKPVLRYPLLRPVWSPFSSSLRPGTLSLLALS
jgi:hypothetical protein